MINVHDTTGDAYNLAYRDTYMRLQVLLVVFPVFDIVIGHL